MEKEYKNRSSWKRYNNRCSDSQGNILWILWIFVMIERENSSHFDWPQNVNEFTNITDGCMVKYM